MSYKKKSLILVIFLIIGIQILLLNNNRQKTAFRYLIWNIRDVSIGRLICVSFISGTVMSSLLNITLHKKENNENDYYINKEENNEINEIPPERDLRESQPTISVNYRVIKDNSESESKDRKQASNKTQYQDDWNRNDYEW